ncbi:MAG: hypothetical protein AMXMBFR64_13520 [Myxococcales bacterium]
MTRGITFCRVCRRHFDEDRAICPTDGVRLRGPSAELPPFGAVVDGRYVVLDRIGSGGMGAVHRAFDTVRHLDVAIKVTSPAMATRADGVERFFREVRAVRRLAHPSIVSVHGFGRTADGLLYLVMELLGGECLATILRREGRLSPARAAGLAEQVAAALGAAHDSGVVHRDLKPENFRLLPGNLLKILDFGIASLTGDGAPIEGPRTVCGTPAYMSPEHALGLRCEPRSDLYGLGVLVFELIAGRPPYSGADPLAVIRAHMVEPVPSLAQAAPDAGVTPELDALVASLLAKSAGDRPASAGHVRERFGVIRRDLEARGRGRLSLSTLGAALESVPFHERPTLVLEDDSAPSERATLTDVGRIELPTAPLGAEGLRLCRACGRIGAGVGDCTHCGRPVDGGQRARAADILRATVGVDPRFVTLPPPLPPPERPAGVERLRLGLLHVWLRPTSEDAEAWRPELEPAIEAWADGLASLGGTVCRSDGASVRAVFGLQGPTPGPSRAAVAAALALRAALRAARDEAALPFQIRTGVATGAVWLLPEDRARLDQALMGSPVDVAERLARVASDGAILTDRETAQPLEATRRLQRVGQLAMRGAAVPDSVYAVLGAAELPVKISPSQDDAAALRAPEHPLDANVPAPA